MTRDLCALSVATTSPECWSKILIAPLTKPANTSLSVMATAVPSSPSRARSWYRFLRMWNAYTYPRVSTVAMESAERVNAALAMDVRWIPERTTEMSPSL